MMHFALGKWEKGTQKFQNFCKFKPIDDNNNNNLLPMNHRMVFTVIIGIMQCSR